MTPARAILLGGLTVGVIDGLDAVLFFGARGTAPGVVFQAIASGLLGRSAFSGGAASVALGVVLHFTIATTIVAFFWLTARRVRFIAHYPLRSGLVYGLVVYVVMTVLIVPLSRASGATPTIPVLLNGLLIHMLGVGLPAAWFARASMQLRSHHRSSPRVDHHRGA